MEGLSRLPLVRELWVFDGFYSRLTSSFLVFVWEDCNLWCNAVEDIRVLYSPTCGRIVHRSSKCIPIHLNLINVILTLTFYNVDMEISKSDPCLFFLQS